MKRKGPWMRSHGDAAELLEAEPLLDVRPIGLQCEERGLVGTEEKRIRGALEADRGTGSHAVVVPRPHRGVIGNVIKKPTEAEPLNVRVHIVGGATHFPDEEQ